MVMEDRVTRLTADLKTSEATSNRYLHVIEALEKRRDALEDLVEGLEGDVARLEAEGLKPLVDRLRLQVGAMRKLLIAMGEAIATLTGDEMPPEAIAAIEEVDEAISRTGAD
jgi:hypothetical protein